ncbi:transcriptional regulator, partial [Oleoguttula sp. CCFEE 5521]
MAAVQPAQGMQQQTNNANMMAQQNILPAGMTKEQVQQIYKKYQMMKAQGVPDNDPELIKARGVLQSIQQKTEMIKRQQAFRQQQQAQLKQQQQAALQQNGMAGSHDMNGGSMPAQPSVDTQGQQGQSQMPSTNGATPTPTSAVSNNGMAAGADGGQDTALSKEQVEKLRYQMKAFTALQRN